MKFERIFGYGAGALILLLWASVFSAENPPDERAAVEEIIERYIASQGGRERMNSLRRMELEGRMELKSQGLNIEVRQKLQTPDKVFMVSEVPGLGTVRQILNGDQGWEKHPLTGTRSMEEREVNDLLREADLQRDLRLFEVYKQIRLAEPEEIEGHMTRHLVFLDANGKEEHWYFKENGDLFQQVRDVPIGPGGEVEIRQRHYDFTTVEGFRFPKLVRLYHPAFEAELTITQCRINPEFDPAIFQVPMAPVESGE